MARRFNDYRVNLGDDIGRPDFWNTRLGDIDLRIVELEDIGKDWSAALATITKVGLDRINEVLLPAYQEVRRLADLGAIFTGHSTSELTLDVGLKRITIAESERDAFAPAAYVGLLCDNDVGRAMLGRVLSYDRAAGILEVDVDRVAGAGSGAPWTIFASSATDNAQAAKDAQDALVTIAAYRVQIEGFMLSADASASSAVQAKNLAITARTAAELANVDAQAAKTDTLAGIAAWVSSVLAPAEVAPTTRAGGAALQVGDQYFKPSDAKWRTWDGTQWTVNAVPMGSEVGSVFGRTGTISAQAGDYRGDQVARSGAQQAVIAGADVEAALQTVDARVATEEAARATADALKADKTTTVSGGGLVSGGGDLSADRTLTVTKSSQAQAQAGADDTTAMTPIRVKDAIDTLVPAATTTAAGKVELATDAEAITGTDQARAPSVKSMRAAIDDRIASVTGAAPAALDTLNEIAAALGNDANFAATITGQISAKLNASAVSSFALTLLDDGDAATMRATLGLGAIALKSSLAIADITSLQTSLDGKLASASYTAADVLAKMLTVDGSGSGLDADTVRGTVPSAFGRARLSDADASAAKAGLAIAWGDVSGKPSFGAVATSNSYNDLSNKPTIPAAGGKAADQQVFTASGTWTKPSGFGAKAYVFIQLWGGGGGGGRNIASDSGGGGGGGGGGYSEAYILLSSLGSTETVTIGAGGTGRITNTGVGTDGGSTTFGSWSIVYGGKGGTQSGTQTANGSGNGGNVSGVGLERVVYHDGESASLGGHPQTQWGGASTAMQDSTSAWHPPGNGFWGGGGGGGASSTAAYRTGGTSKFGGNGGNGSASSGAASSAGSQPAGGGGGGWNANGSDGGAGKAIVTVFDGA
jgi:hypothetical protein